MKVLFLLNVPSPYSVDFLNELGKYCQVTAIFELENSLERDTSWLQYQFNNFTGIILHGIRVAPDMAFCPQIVFRISRKYDFIIVGNPATPTGIAAILFMKMVRITFCLQSEGGFAKDGKGIKEKFKRFLMRNAKLYFSTTPVGDDYFIMYGANHNKIVKYPFTSLFEKDILDKIPSAQEKQNLRTILHIPEEKVVLSVGRIIPVKGFDTLLKASTLLAKDIGIYIIGGSPTEEFVAFCIENNLRNVHFISNLSKEQLNKYYLLSDIFVLPTRGDTWGLVINEAMAKGLPVITTTKCVAGTELVTNGMNGFLISADDEISLARTISLILNDADLQRKMGMQSLEKIKWYSYESMAKNHYHILKNYLDREKYIE